MINPWAEWQKMVRAGTMMSETFSATQAVVENRSKTIEAAMNDPMQADMVELGRMVSEKSNAFGAAGLSLSKDWLAMQRDISAQMTDLSAMMLGKLPSSSATSAMFARGQRLGGAALASGVRAMTPIHKAATANQRRLARNRRRRSA